MECLSCVFCKDRECRNQNVEEELARRGECPGYRGVQDARDDAKLRWAEKG